MSKKARKQKLSESVAQDPQGLFIPPLTDEELEMAAGGTATPITTFMGFITAFNGGGKNPDPKNPNNHLGSYGGTRPQ